MHAWPKALKHPADYHTIAFLFSPARFWTFADPWDLTICPSPLPPSLPYTEPI